jgi:hypothetical protein
MQKIKLSDLRIGERVYSHRTIQTGYQDDKKKHRVLIYGPPVDGYYVGYTYKITGDMRTSRDGFGNYEYGYLVNVKRYLCYKVLRHPRHNPLYVLAEDLMKGGA